MGWRMLGETVFGERGSLRRRYAVATIIFGLMVLGIILLFGHLISQSLSRQYIHDVLVAGREDAERIAEHLEPQGEGQLQVASTRREELVRTLAGLAQRRILESVEVTDASGEVVFTSDFRSQEALPKEMVSHLELSGEMSGQGVRETETTYQISAPIGEVGQVVLNVSKGRLASRAVRLRQELLQQTVAVAALTLGTLVIAFVFNWTLIQRARRLEDERREAEELAALGSLAANLAHEIRNPLNSITLNLELLEEDLDRADSRALASLSSTRQEVSRLARLVSDFLTYARPTPPELERVRVAILLIQVAEFLRGEARSQGVNLRVAPGLPEVEVLGDGGQLRQVLLNLVLNGIQAVAGLDVERRVVEVAATAGAEHAQLIVRDRGEGIPADQLERVRKAFVTRRRGGTGLGLAIAERIVRSHGGRVELRNLEPGGFEAVVVLPIAPGDGKIGAASAEPAARGGNGRRLTGTG